MKTVKATLVGGLGNQMFIAAAAVALAERLGSKVQLDHTDFRSDPGGRKFALQIFPGLAERVEGIEPGRVLPPSLRRRIDRLRRDVFSETGFSYDPRFETLQQPVRLRGYFQSYRYFTALDVRSIFALQRRNPRLAAIQTAVGERWIGMHVRRGDYLNPDTSAYHGVCSDGYFAQGLAQVRANISDSLPVVMFTDQPAALSSRLLSLADLVVGPETEIHEAIDLWAMSHASALVLSNSSFSWWAAFLGEGVERPVVAPRPWLRINDQAASDLLLPHWLTLGAR